MLNEEQIIDKLKEMIPNDKLEHTLRVREIALTLAQRYNVPLEKANIAALLHDCAKGLEFNQALDLCMQLNVETDELSKKHLSLLHAPLGAELAKSYFEVQDEEVLNAIKYHTTGHENMTMLEKIIWISDYIEPDRDFEGVEQVRNIVFEDINAATLLGFKQTIDYVTSKNYLLHQNTVAGYDSILKQFYSY